MSQIKPNYDTNRQRLADIIPLEHPFTIYIEQTKYCNFKCYYCMHATHGIMVGEVESNVRGVKIIVGKIFFDHISLIA